MSSLYLLYSKIKIRERERQREGQKERQTDRKLNDKGDCRTHAGCKIDDCGYDQNYFLLQCLAYSLPI